MMVTLFLAIVSGAPFAVGELAAQDRYAECQLRARRTTGYDGSAPGSTFVGNAAGGAVRGAAIGALVGGIFGGKDGAKKGAKKAAIGGGIRAALRGAGARKAADERRRNYQFEMDQCMSQPEPRADPEPPSPPAAPPAVALADETPPDQELSDEPFSLETLSCLNVVSVDDDDDRASLLLLTYGYSAGKADDATHSVSKVSEALPSFGAACSSPDRVAWEALREATPQAPVPAAEGFNLEELSCWDVMTVSGDGRDFATLLLYGFAAGKAGDSLHSAERIGSVLERTNTYCEVQVEAPMANLIETALKR